MKLYFYIALSILLGVYSLVNYYIGIRILNILTHWLPSINSRLYWFIIIMLASSYILSRLLDNHVPLSLVKLTTIIGAYWLAVLFYSVIIFVAVDILVLVFEFLGFSERTVVNTYLKITGVISIALISTLLVYGTVVARNPKITEYDITLSKQQGRLEKLNAVLISDIHLGKIIDNSRLKKLVEMVQEIDPDIIFIAGDIVDEDIRPFTKEKMYETFGNLKPIYGIYACLGNHDYIGGDVEEIIKHLEIAGIHVLVNEYIMVEDSVYIAGSNDPTGARISNTPRKELNEWLVDFENKLPVILLDHQPKYIQEAAANGVSLLLAGHTHLGQMFPNMYITSLIYQNDYGYSRVKDTDVIVSSGYGTWGPPIRVGTRGEVVKINIKFE